MSLHKRVAFYAPIKPPDHPIPSGDRLIAQNLLKALALGGHSVDLASRYICYSKRSATTILKEKKTGALKEAANVLARYRALSEDERPQIWITYHPYCKAPDWIGSLVSKELGIPYITIEAARTGQGGQEDEWRLWREEAQPRIEAADLHIVFKPSDHAFLLELLGHEENLAFMVPFIDTDGIEAKSSIALPNHWNSETPVIVTTGMMRKGKKDRNFYMLADILGDVLNASWKLVVVGGGPEEDNIRAAFSSIPEERIHWTGQVEPSEVISWMRAGDLFIWPGWKEPIGMVYLEAQSQGLPVLAYESMGVPLVVEHEVTGLLAPEVHVDTMRSNLRVLLQDGEKRQLMSKAAIDKVTNEHSIRSAAVRLTEILQTY